MARTFSAIFENGVFRPIEPVDFPERCRVCVEVRGVQAAADDAGHDEAYAKAPTPQRVRLVGTLSAIGAGTHAFDLVLDDGRPIPIELVAGDTVAVARLVNQRVLVLGRATYGPSGNLLSIDADDVSLSGDDGHFFSAPPRPVGDRFELDVLLHEQRHKRGLAAIIGQWPGDESDDEIAAALKAPRASLTT